MAWQRGISASARDVLFLGFSLVYVPLAYACVAATNQAWDHPWSAWLMLFMVAAYACALVRFLVVRRRLLRVPQQGVCEECGYDLRGLAHGAVCPECGRDVPSGRDAPIVEGTHNAAAP